MIGPIFFEDDEGSTATVISKIIAMSYFVKLSILGSKIVRRDTVPLKHLLC